MKVLLINDYGTLTGGAEVMLVAMRGALRARGHDARLFTSSARPLGGEVPSEADYECFGTTSRWRTLLQTANPWAPARLRKVLAEFSPDVVHVRLFLTQLSPLILSLLRDVPAILHLETYRVVCPLGTKRLPDGRACHRRAGVVCRTKGCLPLRDWPPLMLQTALWRRQTPVFDRVVANSAWMARRVAEDGIEASTVIWNGVASCQPRGPLSGPPVVGFAGRLVREKGTDVLLRAMALVRRRLPDARVVLAGDGPERENLLHLARDLELGDAVSFLGHVEHGDLERHLAVAWVQAVPSTWEEPFGIVAAEAMMRGTAVVASDSGGLSEIVEHGRTGARVAPGSPEALAEALVGILGDRERAERMGAEARAFAEARLGLEAHVERFLEIYRDLCG
jgi:glycosyltransferase involved in cell wall biosynthesis